MSKADELLPSIVAALEWAMRKAAVVSPSEYHSELYRSEYHTANNALFVARAYLNEKPHEPPPYKPVDVFAGIDRKTTEELRLPSPPHAAAEPEKPMSGDAARYNWLCNKWDWDYTEPFNDVRFKWFKRVEKHKLDAAIDAAMALSDYASPSAQPIARDRVYWVLERFENGKSQGYWDGGNSRSFTFDINKAIQFCRREDVFWVTRGWHWTDCEPVQHMDCAGPNLTGGANG